MKEVTLMKPLVRIGISDHSRQRYPTAGDWQYTDDGALMITVSLLEDRREMYLLAIHELIEAVLCEFTGIRDADVDAWDMNNPEGAQTEPGAHPNAPYHWQHTLAEIIERIVAWAIGVNWDTYSKHVEDLDHERE